MLSVVERRMREAMSFALKAKGATFPNPLVGAIIIKNGRVLGRGFHREAGGPHAEIEVLRKAGQAAAGATLFCTMEPCAHFGQTGPCVDAIIKAKIKKVYVGTNDPNPVNRGRGIAQLRRSGIKVEKGFLERELKAINAPFFKAMTKGKPFVTVKIAETLDGRVATAGGESRWITAASTRRFSRGLRRYHDGIVVGINTVLKDDPRLEPLQRRGHRLAKVIVDSSLRMPLNARLLKTRQPVFVATVKKDYANMKALSRMGAEVIQVKPKRGKVDLKALLRELHKRQLRSLLVEGGPKLIGSFLDERLADKAIVFIALKIVGGEGALGAVAGTGVRRLRKATLIEKAVVKRCGPDLFIEGYLRYGRPH